MIFYHTGPQVKEKILNAEQCGTLENNLPTLLCGLDMTGIKMLLLEELQSELVWSILDLENPFSIKMFEDMLKKDITNEVSVKCV